LESKLTNKVISRLTKVFRTIAGIRDIGKIQSYLGKYIEKGKEITVIDIGAHKGTFIDELNRYFVVKEAILVEPIAHLSKLLKEKFDGRKYAIYQNVLTSEDDEEVEFCLNEFEETSSLLQFNSGMSELANINTNLSRIEKIRTRTLDSIREETRIDHANILKIDVQGSELDVLISADRTLEITEYIWVELSFKPLYVKSAVFSEVHNFLTKKGFLLLEISPGHRSSDGELLQADVLFVKAKSPNQFI
jgi:FkbM family methyltransferase